LQLPTTRLQISEHGVHFNETLTFDPSNNLVTFHVPQHHDLAEHVTVMHNATGKSLTFLPAKSLCELKDIPVEIDPIGTFHSLSLIQALNPVATPEESKSVHFLELDLGPANSEDMAALPESMRNMCQDVPVRRVVEVEADGDEDIPEETIQKYVDLEKTRRAKREVQNCDMTYLVTRKVPSEGRCRNCHTCLYATCNFMNPAPRCFGTDGAFIQHFITSPSHAAVVCCEGNETEMHCNCDSLRELEETSPEFGRKFLECQADDYENWVRTFTG